jgi:hypothetical protein
MLTQFDNLRTPDLSEREWLSCNDFAFQYTKQKGYLSDVQFLHQISESESYWEQSFQEGLNIAMVSCKFWRDFYKKDNCIYPEHTWSKKKKYLEEKDKNGNDTIRVFRVCLKCNFKKEIKGMIVCYET